MIEGILAGIAAKLAGLGLAAKVGTGIAAATLATAGVATVAPVLNAGAPAGVEVQIPTIANANADFGLNVAANATGAQAGTGPVTVSFLAEAESTTAGTVGVKRRLPAGMDPARMANDSKRK